MKEVAKILYGSNNYHLDGPESDEDYKFLMMPDFDDLYHYHKTDKGDLPRGYDSDHYSVMSIITFDKHIRQGNFNAIELLFSLDCTVYKYVDFYMSLARKAYAEGYIYTVWDSFLATVEGLIKNSLRRYGANRKSTSRAVYMINLCRFIAEHDFAIDRRSTWDAAAVYAEARAIRFDEDIPIPTEEQIYNSFEGMRKYAENERNYFKLMYSESEIASIAAWNDHLAKCMKDTVKESLRHELV